MANGEDFTQITERVAKSLEERTVRFTKDQLVPRNKVPCLNLPDLREIAAYGFPDSDDYLLIECEPADRMTVCPCCKRSGYMLSNGYTEYPRLVHDVNVGVTQVDLSVRVPKYRCKSCDATPNHEFESIVPNRQFTKRLLTQIKVEAFRGNFEDVATNYGISPTVVASIFDAYAEELEGKRGVVSIGYWLAIDEKHVDHKMRGILVDGEDGILLEMTEDTKPETIKKAIMSLNGYEKVRYVTTDMAGGYRNVIEQIYGSSVLHVVDKWHVLNDLYTKISKCRTAVIEYLNSTVPKEPDSVLKRRRMELKKIAAEDGYLFKYGDEKLSQRPAKLQLLAEVCSTFPEYNHLRLLKEGFERIYDCQTRAEALEAFSKWAPLVPPSGSHQREAWEAQYHLPAALFDAIRPLKKTAGDTWNREIFNYFEAGYERPLTNAIAESTNSFVARFSKEGYSFPRLRAKSLFWHLAGRRTRYVAETRTKEVIGKKKNTNMPSSAIGYYSPTFFSTSTTMVRTYGIYQVEDTTRYKQVSVLSYLSDEKKKEWNDYVLGLG